MIFKWSMERLFTAGIGFYKFWERFYVNTQKAIRKAGRNPGVEDVLKDYDEFLEKQKISKQKDNEQMFFPRDMQWVHLTNGIGFIWFLYVSIVGGIAIDDEGVLRPFSINFIWWVIALLLTIIMLKAASIRGSKIDTGHVRGYVAPKGAVEVYELNFDQVKQAFICKKTNQPYTGLVFLVWNEIIKEWGVSVGKLHGLWIEYYANGDKKAEIEYNKGEQISAKHWNGLGELVDSEEEALKVPPKPSSAFLRT